jgi:anti-anti-sigma factor
MQISVTSNGRVSIFSIAGRLDSVSCAELEQRVDAWLAQGEPWLVMDLQDLGYISSAGLRIVLTTAKKIQARNGSFCLARPQAAVGEVLEVSGFSTIIPLAPDLESALERVR